MQLDANNAENAAEKERQNDDKLPKNTILRKIENG